MYRRRLHRRPLACPPPQSEATCFRIFRGGPELPAGTYNLYRTVAATRYCLYRATVLTTYYDSAVAVPTPTQSSLLIFTIAAVE
eukprot:scaffold47140_cov51-Attheya_sp.AAC.4